MRKVSVLPESSVITRAASIRRLGPNNLKHPNIFRLDPRIRMPRSVISTSDDDLLNILKRRWEHSTRVTESGWNVARYASYVFNPCPFSGSCAEKCQRFTEIGMASMG